MDLGLLIGTGWAAGVNLYAVVAILGAAGRMDWLDGPAILEHPAVLGIAVAMYAVEFVADKVPYLDNLWDVAHTIIRPVGAALVAMALVSVEQDVSTWATSGAAMGSGALALTSHATKATARLALNASPEPFTNIAASVTEDSMVAGMVILAINHPGWAVAAVALLLVLGTAVFVLALRTATKVWRRIRNRESRPTVSRISGRPLA